MLLYLVKMFKFDLFNKLYTRDKDENDYRDISESVSGTISADS